MIDKSNGVPKYLQLKELLKRRMIDDCSPGDLLPTERQIMAEYGVSCATVATAMKLLVKEGCVRRKRGEGTFVLPFEMPEPKAWPPELLVNGLNPMRTRSYNPFSWFIQIEVERGVVNSYDGPVRILDDDELCRRLESGAQRSVVLINRSSKALELIERARCAAVTIGDMGGGLPYVDYQPLPGVYALMKRLIEDLGHRRVGMIRLDNTHHRDRFAGYQIGLRTFGIDYDETLVEVVDRGFEENGYQAMSKLLRLKTPPTAVFVDTDLKAMGALRAAKDAGVRVPEDVSVAGYDDMPGAAELDPPLTTVKVPRYEMGRAAVNLLRQAMGSDETPESTSLPAELVVRKSCAPPGRAGNH